MIYRASSGEEDVTTGILGHEGEVPATLAHSRVPATR